MATHPAVSGKDGDVRLAVRAQPGAKVRGASPTNF